MNLWLDDVSPQRCLFVRRGAPHVTQPYSTLQLSWRRAHICDCWQKRTLAESRGFTHHQMGGRSRTITLFSPSASAVTPNASCSSPSCLIIKHWFICGATCWLLGGSLRASSGFAGGTRTGHSDWSLRKRGKEWREGKSSSGNREEVRDCFGVGRCVCFCECVWMDWGGGFVQQK